MDTAARDARGRGITRRRVLGVGGKAVAGLALAACTGGGGVAPTPRGSDDPDFALRARVYDAERALVAAYDATLARHSSLRTELAGIRDQHLAHAAAFVVDGDLVAAAGPTPSPPAVPASRRAAVAALARLEASAAAARATDCTAASRAGLARLLSLVGGSEAAHAAVLGGGA